VVERTTNKELLKLVLLLLSAAQEKVPAWKLLDTQERDLMANDELLLPVLKALVPRLQYTDFTRSLLKTPDVFGL
jgi:hypothetical protein